LKAGAKAVAKKVTDPDKDLGSEYQKEKMKEKAGDIETDASGSNDPKLLPLRSLYLCRNSKRRNCSTHSQESFIGVLKEGITVR
jgi:hypothetical protein